MKRDIVFVLASCCLAIFSMWWFLIRPGKKLELNDISAPIVITLKSGQFVPNMIRVPNNKEFTIHFLRKDNSYYSDSVFFPLFNISYQLPMNQKLEVVMPPLKKGEVTFYSSTNHAMGNIIVV